MDQLAFERWALNDPDAAGVERWNHGLDNGRKVSIRVLEDRVGRSSGDGVRRPLCGDEGLGEGRAVSVPRHGHIDHPSDFGTNY